MKLNGRTALITGGGSGVGRAIAFRFASEGCHVALADSNHETANAASQEIALTGHRAMAVHMDVSDEASVTRGVERVVENLGHVDILANVAAIWIGGSVTEIAIADWDRVIAVNLRGPFLCSRAILPLMQAQRAGVILNVASITALRVTRGAGAYNPSKAGLVALTKIMALDYAADQIRVNAICPGGISGTEMEGVAMNYRGTTPDEIHRRTLNMYPLGRRGTPDEIAAAAVYLASDDARWVTGSCLVIDGGAMAGFWNVG